MTKPLESALVTGGTGFIGSALVERLAEQSVRVVCPVRASSARTERLSKLPGVEVVRLADESFASWEAGCSSRPCEAVFHLAAYGVKPTDRVADRMIETNVNLTVDLVELTRDWPLRRFVYAGTCSEYTPVDAPTRLNESAPIAPNGLYGATKAAGHLCGRAVAMRGGVPFVSMRLFGVYGPGEAEHRLLPSLVRSLREGRKAALSPGGQQRDLCYVGDAVEGLIQAATHPGVESGSVYNLCTGVGVEVREVARRVAQAMNQPEDLLGFGELSYREGETMWLVGDPSRFEAASGWRPRVDLSEGIRRTIAMLE